MLKKEISYYSIMETKTDDTYTQPRFIKEKYQPLRLGSQGKKINVFYSKKFSKKFRKEIRRMYKIKPFTFPKIKTFEHVGINKSGNIVSKNKANKK